MESLWIKRRSPILFAILDPVRRLIIRPGAIGDFIVSLPALECLRAGYTEVWCAGPNVTLARFADRARSIASTGLDLLGIAQPPSSLIEDLRSFDSIVSWYGANRDDFRAAVAALPFTFFRALPADATLHAADFHLAQVRTIAACSSDGVPRIHCRGARENFAVVHPFSGSPRKNWPLEKFRRVAEGLSRTMPVYWCAGPEDPPLPDAVRFDDLYELACWLSRAALYIGNDSGVSHLAAAAGTPVLALFGPSDPAVWAPRGALVRIGRFLPR